MKPAERVPGHRLQTTGPPGNLSAWTWRCECGAWSAETPARGPFGSTTSKARIAQVQMAHGKHVKFAAAKAKTKAAAAAKDT